MGNFSSSPSSYPSGYSYWSSDENLDGELSLFSS